MLFRNLQSSFMPIFLYLSLKEDYVKALLKGLFPTTLLINFLLLKSGTDYNLLQVERKL
jgi:hypothetical protein